MKRMILSAAAAAMLAAGAAPLWAEESNPAIVHRQGIYKIVGGHMNALKSILFLNFAAPQDVSFHAQGIVEAFQRMGESYPPDSAEGETKTEPAIWNNLPKFKKFGEEAFASAQKLAQASQGADKAATLEAFKELGGKCKQCHDDFRQK
ncbi:MAG: cytochrome c [Magnetococcales bacterium]|nr:cytochrome c [Magnetococcales bacterium]